MCPVNSVSPSESSALSSCQCIPGYSGADGGPCSVCPVNTYTSELSSANCTACTENSASPSGSNVSTSCECNAGYYGPDAGPCNVCPANTYTSELGTANCLACPEHSVSLSGSNAQTGCKCNPGYYGPSGGPCTVCPEDTYASGNGSATCSSCPQHSVSPSGSDTVTRCECFRGYTGPNGGACEACVVGTYKPTVGSIACTSCEVNYYGTAQAEVDVDSCVACPANSTSVSGSSNINQCFCIDGYRQAETHDSCVECSPGFYDNVTTRYECSKCAGGLYSTAKGAIDSETCQPCGVGTWSEIGSPTCQSCPDNSNSSRASAFLSDCKCNPGTTGPDGTTCVLCLSGKYKEGSGAAACDDCPANSFAATGSTLLTSCQCTPGHYGPDGGECTVCPVDTYAFELGTAACLPCPANADSPSGSSALSSCRCNPGYYGEAGGDCTLCPVDTFAAEVGMNACETCPQHSVSPSGSNASSDCLCNIQYYGPKGGPCTLCPVNTFAAAIGMSACEMCPDNSVSPSGSSVLVHCKCDAGYTGSDGGPCVACEAGEYKQETGDAACSSCPAQAHSPAASPARSSCVCNAGYSGADGGPCVACDEGKYKDVAGSTLCASCPAKAHSPEASPALNRCLCNVGYSGADGDECVACVAGKYKDVNGSAVCVACTAGKYLLSEGAYNFDFCTNCAAGTYSTTVGAAAASVCINCAADTYSTTAGASDVSTCTSCPAASSSQEGSSAQVACECDPGYSGSDGGPCTLCAPNSHKSEKGSAECTACPDHSESPAGSIMRSSCQCSIGHYGEHGGQCDVCPENTYAAVLGSAMCSMCPDHALSPSGSSILTACACEPGYTGLNGTACSACSAGKYKDTVGSAACTDCAVGTYLEATGAVTGDACVSCAAGTYSIYAGAFNASACVRCAAGKYSTAMGAYTAADCLECGIDTFSTTEGASSASTCQTCPTSSVSPRGSSAATSCQCIAGYTGQNGGECLECATGKYKEEIGPEACTDCAAGKYLNNTRSEKGSDCVDCVAGKYSTTVGAVAAGTCVNCDAGKYSGTAGASVVGTCASCPAASSSPSGSSVVGSCECNPGYTGPDGGECAACAFGTFKPLPGAQACTLCAVDTYGTASAAVGAGVCAACPANSSSVSGSSGIELCFCADGYRQAATFDACIECAPGFYDESDRFQCSACGGGLYSEVERATGVETCLPCAAGTWSASGSPTCQACLLNSNSAPASALLTDCKCNAGATGADGEACVLCVAGTFKEAPGSVACDVCTQHSLSVVGSALATMCRCLPGYFGSDGGPCAPCVSDTFKDALGSAVCTLCPADAQAPQASAARTDCKCNVGFSGHDGEACVGCAADSFKDSVGSANCSACPANAQSPSESPAATSCQCNAGYTGANGEACALCAAGKFKDAFGPDACTDCAPGKYLESSGALSVEACVACAAGRYSTATGAPLESECVRCEAGKYSTTVGAASESTCVGCLAHAHSPSGSDAVVSCQCNAGYTGPDGGECSACHVGKFKDAIGPATCTKCTAGKYLETTGAYTADACVNCASGMYSTTAGAVSRSTCIKCAADTYSPTEGASNISTCESCPESSSAPSGSSPLTSCECNVGYYGQHGGPCTICPGNTYAPAIGSAECSACPDNAESPSGSSVLTACLCSAGYFGTHGGSCAGCSANTYATELGSASCSECTANSVSPNRSRAVSSCECEPGYYGPHEGPCVQCPVNTYKHVIGAGGEASCLACPPDASTKQRLGQTRCWCDAGFDETDFASVEPVCTACPVGTFNTAEEADGAFLRTCVACGTCGHNTSAGQVASECTAERALLCRPCQAHSEPEARRAQLGPCLCDAGYELAGEQCVACEVGKFRSTNANNSVLCEVCAGGFYLDADAGTQCAPCKEQCVGFERGNGPALEVSVEGRVPEHVILPWLANAFNFAFTTGDVNNGLLAVPLCKADHWASRYTATDRFYYTAHPAPERNVSRSYPRLCRSSGTEAANPADILHTVLWVSDPLYFRSFDGASLSSAQTDAPRETWRAGSFGEFMSSTFAPCVERGAPGADERAYVAPDAALCPIRVAIEPDGLEWRLSPMKFEEPDLLPTTGNTVTHRETKFVEASSGHGAGPFWATFLNGARVFGSDPTVHQHEYVRVDCHPTHDLVCAACAVCAPGTFPNHTCGPQLANDRLDTECANCSVGTVCFGGSGFAPDGGAVPDTPENRPLTCPASSVSAPGATSLAGCQCLAGYYYVVHGDPEDPFTRAECVECPLHHYCPFGSLAPGPCPLHAFTLAPMAGVRLECHCPRGRFRDPPHDEAGFNCSVCTENDFCVDSLRFNCSDELMEAVPGSGFTENCTCIETYYNNGSRCELCSVNHTCAGGVRSACVPNEWTNGARGAQHCLCEPGFFRGEALCEPCSENHFCTGQNDERHECPHYSTSPLGTSRVSECLCELGFGVEYDLNASAFHACRACVVREDGTGQFKDSVANAACRDCSLCDPLVRHTTTAVQCSASSNVVCEACRLCQHVNVSGRDVDYQSTPCQTFSQTVCDACRVCNDTFEWQSMPCQESANRECELIDFSTPCAPGRYRGNHTKNKDSECLLCQYQDTTYQGSHLHEAVTPGRTYDDAFSCGVRCLPFSRLRDPARHWLGCVTCETGNVLFKHMAQDESSSVCRFECTHGHVERRNADGLDGDCVPGVLQSSSAYFAHAVNVTNVRRVPRSDAAGAAGADLAAFRFSLAHTTHGHFAIVVGAAEPACSEHARQHLELHCCFADLWRVSTKRQMGISAQRNETCSRPFPPWSQQTSDSQLEFEIPDTHLSRLGICAENGTGLDCEIVISIVDTVLFKSASTTVRLQVQRGSAHALLHHAHRYVPLTGFAVEVQLAYYDSGSPVFIVVTDMAPLPGAGTTGVSVRGVGMQFVEPASALNCGRLSIAGPPVSRRNWTLGQDSGATITLLRAAAGHSLVQLYYTLRLSDREDADIANQMDLTVWRNVSLRRPVCEEELSPQTIDAGVVFSASGLGADAVAHASRLPTADHSVRGELGALSSFVACSLLRHIANVRVASMLLVSALEPGLLGADITELKQGRLDFTPSFRQTCLAAGTPQAPVCAYQYLHYDPHVQGIYTFRSCSPEAQAAARAWLRAVFGVHDDSGHVAALCARSRVFSDYPFAITMVNTRAYLPRTPQWRVFQNRNTPARSSRVFALFRFE